MSINSALVKLADKIDVDGKSTISSEYKNPNNSIEKSIERIADNYNGSGGGGGTGEGVLVVNVSYDEGTSTYTMDKTWSEIKTALQSKTPCYAYTEIATYTEFISIISAFVNTLGDTEYGVAVPDGRHFTAKTENGYPSYID